MLIAGNEFPYYLLPLITNPTPKSRRKLMIVENAGGKVVGKCPVYFPVASKQRAKIAESLEAEPASAFPSSLPPYI